MGLMSEGRKEVIRRELEEKMEHKVRIVMFTQEFECDFCSDTRKLVEELAGLSPKIAVEIFDFVADSGKAKEFGIDKIPALAIIGEEDFGVRIFGVPSGYELRTLVEAVITVSRGRSDLSERTKKILSEIRAPVHIQVFVSLTCPHCPIAAAVAHKLAVENSMVKADVIDINEFPYLSQKYAVMGVPKIIINEKVEFTGSFNEDLFAEHVLLGAY
ncbi:thioredoxin family protein [Candidatus Bathyarchaeota archaeon]|nr:thioredoxin family protein [Candidatus Bathyarchaeota archaeon]